ncbi:MAG: exodeoxyribonuclease VII large subunit [Pseudomonadales bacterium]|nr:exodeoxyribonuclease VII large subunit [Pseudomonadales bacterium]
MKTPTYRSKMPERTVISISKLNRKVKQLIEGGFPPLWVEAELSNLSQPSSGHLYFTLKDDKAQVRCAMFKGRNRFLQFTPKAGERVMARVQVSLYENRGDFQLIVDRMEAAGEGALRQSFEQLKERLLQEGLFDAELKQELPTMPSHIVVITSSTGAVVHDILTVLERRFPLIRVTLIPVVVQGSLAAQQIADAIETANQLTEQVDAIIVGRGGGSLEDLWAFNEEVVARAIFHSDIPIVSAIGHEVDITIADYVADVRAPTPSAAAELLSPDQQEVSQWFASIEQQLARAMTERIQEEQHRTDWLRARLRHPGERLSEQSQRIDELELRLTQSARTTIKTAQLQLTGGIAALQQHNPAHHVARRSDQLQQLMLRLKRQMKNEISHHKTRLQNVTQNLDIVSPLATLSRGYSIVAQTENGELVRSHQQVKPGDKLTTRLAEGSLECTVNRSLPTQ